MQGWKEVFAAPAGPPRRPFRPEQDTETPRDSGRWGRRLSRGVRGPRRRSGALGQLGLDGDVQVGLVEPAAGVGGAVPALEGDRADVLALLVVEDVEVGLREVGADLGGGTAEVDQ